MSYPTFCTKLGPMRAASNQRDRVISALSKRGMARLSELMRLGVTQATVARLEREGVVIRLGRGLYQLPDAPLDVHHSLAEAAKLAPRGIICLVSALAFHGLTDRIPSKIWMAIGQKDRKPAIKHPSIEFVRFKPKTLNTGIEQRAIESVQAKIYGPAKTVVDLFRYRRKVGLNVAIEGLKEAIRQRKATPSEIARFANEAGAWRMMRPYVEALTVNG